MKILVVDDSIKQQEAAKLTLNGHDLTVVASALEARDLLKVKFDCEKLAELEKEAGFPEGYESWEEKDEEKKAIHKALSNKCNVYPDFDAVFTDLLMPGEKKGIGPQGDEFVGQPTPYGLGIALLALKSGIKHVAIVSDGDHHDHPILWFCDAINGDVISGLKIFTFNVGMRKEDYPDIDKPWEYKDWNRALKSLLGEPDKDSFDGDI